MCWWGIAYAWGPNINAPMGPEGAAAGLVCGDRRRSVSRATPRPTSATTSRRSRRATSKTPLRRRVAQRKALDAAYANAMRDVHAKQPNDADAAALFAESLMDLSPWDYWQDDGSPRAHTQEAGDALAASLAIHPDHTGALHYTIHLYERFEPERAEPAADRLKVQAPAAGHLVHMPAHIYFRVGRYKDSADINEEAAAADVAWFSWCRAPAAYAALYYTHNLHFLWASAMIEGRSDAALTAARRIVAQVPTDQLATFPFLEDFLVTPLLHAGAFRQLGRDPRRAAAAREPALHDRDLALHPRARLHAPGKARGSRHRGAGVPGDRERSRASRRWASTPTGGTAGERLDVAKHHLAGEMASARGDHNAAIAEFEQAIAIQDAMPYSEPPPFYFPVRQALGAELLESGRAQGGRGRLPRRPAPLPANGWSLFGLSKSLAAQGKSAQARGVSQGFQNAWARADVTLHASAF